MSMKSEKINYRRNRIIVTALAPPGDVSEDTAQGKWEVSADLGVVSNGRATVFLVCHSVSSRFSTFGEPLEFLLVDRENP